MSLVTHITAIQTNKIYHDGDRVFLVSMCRLPFFFVALFRYILVFFPPLDGRIVLAMRPNSNEVVGMWKCARVPTKNLKRFLYCSENTATQVHIFFLFSFLVRICLDARNRVQIYQFAYECNKSNKIISIIMSFTCFSCQQRRTQEIISRLNAAIRTLFTEFAIYKTFPSFSCDKIISEFFTSIIN